MTIIEHLQVQKGVKKNPKFHHSYEHFRVAPSSLLKISLHKVERTWVLWCPQLAT